MFDITENLFRSLSRLLYGWTEVNPMQKWIFLRVLTFQFFFNFLSSVHLTNVPTQSDTKVPKPGELIEEKNSLSLCALGN